MRASLVALTLLVVSGTAAADDDHTVYVEAAGRGGLYGLGYDYQLTTRWSVGATLSAYKIYGQTVLTAAPYFGVYLLRGKRHAWFSQIGPQFSRVSVESPTMTWDGASSSGFGGHLSSGWEYRNRIVVRTFATVTVGPGGIAPWAGSSIGVEF